MIHAEPRYWTDTTIGTQWLEISVLSFSILRSRTRIFSCGYVFYQELDMTWVWEPEP